MGCQFNNKVIINESVKRGTATTECDSNGNNILMIAYMNGHQNLCKYLIDDFALASLINEPNKTGDNILAKSIKDNNENFARYLLLKQGVKIDFTDNQGKTLLAIASEIGLYTIVEILLSKQADPNVQDKYGYSAIMLAAKNNNELCVQALLKLNKLNVAIKDYQKFGARNYAKTYKIKAMITDYMKTHNQLTASLLEEMEEEKYK